LSNFGNIKVVLFDLGAAAAIGMNAALCKSPADAVRELQKL
jgi:hypothetical protein